MSTELTPPNDDDTPRMRDGYSAFCESKTSQFLHKKLENARTSMEAAAGTPQHPRMVVEYQLAQVQLDNAILEEKLKAVQDFAYEQNTLLADTRRQVAYLQDFLNDIPQRLLILENSYASLHMATHKNHFVDSIVEAYKIGLNKSDKPKES